MNGFGEKVADTHTLEANTNWMKCRKEALLLVCFHDNRLLVKLGRSNGENINLQSVYNTELNFVLRGINFFFLFF